MIRDEREKKRRWLESLIYLVYYFACTDLREDEIDRVRVFVDTDDRSK